jgi:lysophospholipase L1-like esterase
MRTVLCYGDSNTWGAAPMAGPADVRRFGFSERWPGVLRSELGEGWWVIEEGLNGRTTVHDDPIEGVHRNGRRYLAPCLETHAPLDLVVLMLGTNDLKHRFGASAFDIASGVGVLIDDILAGAAGPDGEPPRILLLCPPPLAQLTWLADMFGGGAEKSQALARHYGTVAKARNCGFLDTGEVIVSSQVDGIHFEANEHEKLGRAVAVQVRGILETTS